MKYEKLFNSEVEKNKNSHLQTLIKCTRREALTQEILIFQPWVVGATLPGNCYSAPKRVPRKTEAMQAMGDMWAALTDEEIMRLNLQNPELRFECNADGALVTVSPSGAIAGNREAKALAYLLNWVESHDLGEVFGSSTGFKLENGAVRSPNAAFVAKERLPEAWDEGEDEYLPLAPDFVIEVCSKPSRLDTLKAKMNEYVTNSVRLGWLIDRPNQQAWVYQGDGLITQLPATAILSGEDVVPGFKLALKYLL